MPPLARVGASGDIVQSRARSRVSGRAEGRQVPVSSSPQVCEAAASAPELGGGPLPHPVREDLSAHTPNLVVGGDSSR